MKFKTIVIFVAFISVIVALVGAIIYYSSEMSNKKANEALQLAKGMIESGETTQALQQLEVIRTKYARADAAEEADFLFGKLLLEEAKTEEAAQVLEAFLNSYPESEFVPEAHYLQATILLMTEPDVEQAEQVFEEIIAKYPDSSAAHFSSFGLAKIAYKFGEMEKARKSMLDILDKKISPELRGQVGELAGKVNLAVLFSPVLTEQDKVHTVERNDSVYEMSKRYGVTVDLIARCNELEDPSKIRIGQKLKIPSLNLRLDVDKGTNKLTVYNNDQFFKSYKVSTSKFSYKLPTNEYLVRTRQKNRKYFDMQTREYYEPGHPQNEYGTRWIGLDASGQIGIHGTPHPELIGDYTPHGCIAMRNSDVEELFDIVKRGTKVKVFGEKIRERGAE